jgi:hypothetical protein
MWLIKWMMYSKPRINFLLLLLDGDPTASSSSRASNSNTSSQEVELLVNDWEWQFYSVCLSCLKNLLPGFCLLVDQLHESLHLHETSAPHTVKRWLKIAENQPWYIVLSHKGNIYFQYLSESRFSNTNIFRFEAKIKKVSEFCKKPVSNRFTF